MKKILEKFKNSKFAKAVTVACITAMVACFGCLGAFAEEASGADLTSTLSTSFNSIKTDILSYVGVALPIALGIVAAIFGIKFAIRFFKSIAGK